MYWGGSTKNTQNSSYSCVSSVVIGEGCVVDSSAHAGKDMMQTNLELGVASPPGSVASLSRDPSSLGLRT